MSSINPKECHVIETRCGGHGIGHLIGIVLFILLVIIIGSWI